MNGKEVKTLEEKRSVFVSCNHSFDKLNPSDFVADD